jgi:Spy/CpxP family protein refolding chaperone
MSLANKNIQRSRNLTVAFGTLGVAAALFSVMPDAHAWGWSRWHRPAETVEELRERMRDGADRMLSMADATEAQEAAVYAVLDEAAPELFAHRTKSHALRDELVKALGARKVNREELERIRKAGLIQADEFSLQGLEIVAQVADILTPAQRAELLEMWQRWHR